MSNQEVKQGAVEAPVIRNYKDTLFRLLFKEKDKLLSLYNAVNETNYQNPEELEIVTLENAIYMAMKNDIAFILDLELLLYEHQSTFNPNIPLRDLFYVSKELEKITRNKSLYLSKEIKIPTPRFVVFYNGKESQPDRKILKLSDYYQKKVEDPDLELKVLMLNINEGRNPKLLEACQTLKEYAIYVGKVRKYLKEMKLADAVEKAITESIQENILQDILLKYRNEVIAMSIFEYDEERELKLLREGERELGRLAGLEEGRTVGLEEGIRRGQLMQKNIIILIQKMLSDGLENQVARLSEEEFLKEMLEKYKL